MSRLRNALAVTVMFLLATAVPASAHVTVHSDDAVQGGYGQLAFRVPTESDTAATTGLQVAFPADHRLAFVAVRPHAGWTYKVVKSAVRPPLVDDDGNQVAEAVSEIDWTATGPDSAIRPGSTTSSWSRPARCPRSTAWSSGWCRPTATARSCGGSTPGSRSTPLPPCPSRPGPSRPPPCSRSPPAPPVRRGPWARPPPPCSSPPVPSPSPGDAPAAGPGPPNETVRASRLRRGARTPCFDCPLKGLPRSSVLCPTVVGILDA